MQLKTKAKEVRVPQTVVTEVTVILEAAEARGLMQDLEQCSGIWADRLWRHLNKVLR